MPHNLVLGQKKEKEKKITQLSCPNAMHGKLELLSPGGKQAAIVRHYLGFYIFFLPPCVQCFRVSVIHQTLTWTTVSLTCVRDHSCACAYTQGLGNTDESAQYFDWEKLSQICLVPQTGFKPLVMESIGSRGRRSTN